MTKIRNRREMIQAIVLAVVAIGVVSGVLVRRTMRLTVMKGWPSVDGVVVSCEMADAEDKDRVQIEYSYSVGEAQYINNVVKLGGIKFSGQAEARAFVEKYPAGKIVPVYHDPEEPGRSLLMPATPPRVWLLLACPLLMIAAFALMLYTNRTAWRIR